MSDQQINETVEEKVTEEVHTNEPAQEPEEETVRYYNKLEEAIAKHPKKALIIGFTAGALTLGFGGYFVTKLIKNAAKRGAHDTAKHVAHEAAKALPEKAVEALPEVVTPVAETVADVAQDVATEAVTA